MGEKLLPQATGKGLLRSLWDNTLGWILYLIFVSILWRGLKACFWAVTFPFWFPFWLRSRGFEYLKKTFWVFIRGSKTIDPATGRAARIELVSFASKQIHYHPLVWGGLCLALIQWSLWWATGINAFVGIAMVYLVLYILCRQTVHADVDLQSLIKLVPLRVGGYLILEGFLIFGSRLALARLPAWSWSVPLVEWEISEEILAAPLEYLRYGATVRIWEFLTITVRPTVSSGMLLLLSLLKAWELAPMVFDAVLNRRYTLDPKTVTPHKWQRRVRGIKVYMQDTELQLSDSFERIWGFADAVINTRNGKLRLPNCLGLGWRSWLGRAFEELYTDYDTPAERRAREAAAGRDLSQNVEEFREEWPDRDDIDRGPLHPDRDDAEVDDDIEELGNPSPDDIADIAAFEDDESS